ncbi:uncharacterized protein LOC121517021 [Xyrichtys novacula]|uniref:Uncharacterized protein LOC121517021 n=1 Tax=Xyrichtys novacula TaxID=13765 RepID=A0AAV1FW91_XYRNO|nr:uncharacterized protein LOC121517021 [Xyrichtys novacula]
MAQEFGGCGETTWARDDVSGRVGGKMHVSVCRQSDGRMRLELCKECKLYHCPFCQPKSSPSCFFIAEYSIHVCQLKCRKERHYHCPYCQRTISARKLFESHMDKCAKMQKLPGTLMAGRPTIFLVNLASPVSLGQFLATPGPPLPLKSTSGPSPDPPQSSTQSKSTPDLLLAPPEPPAQPKSTRNHLCTISEPPVISKSTPDPGLSPSSVDQLVQPKTTANHPAALSHPPTSSAVHPSSSMDIPVKQTGPILRTLRKIKCPLCNLHLNKKNLRIHNLRRHLISERDITAEHHLKSQCIDSNNGVYAVAKAFKATAVPLHVIIKKSGGADIMTCEEDRCKSVSGFRKRSSLTEGQCPHLRSVDFCSTRSNTVDLNPEVLEELVAQKMIRKDVVARCHEYRDQASQNKAPLVALVDLGGSHCLYLSVFEPHMSECCSSGRLFVTFTLKSRSWSCVCSRGRVPCLHRSLAKWFLFQTNRELFSSTAKEDAPLNISELMTKLPAETGPEPVSPLKQTAEYIYKQKKLPSMLPEEINLFESETNFQKNLIPAETVCKVCRGQVRLTEPVLITDRARVISETGVTEDNSTFIRKCPECQMVYRYQEWTEGLHNYNNLTILSLQLCMLLRNFIKIHAADGGAEVLKRTEGVQSPYAMDVLQGYIHFEVLTNHDRHSDVMMELHQKGMFNMAGIEIKDLPESSTGDVEMNLEDFWDRTCLEIIQSSLETRSLLHAAAVDVNLKDASVSAVPTVFTPAQRKRFSKQRAEECHRAVARFLVKGLHPVSTVESPWFREMTELLNQKYRLPSRDHLINTLIPSLFSAEKKSVIRELQQVSEAALTCDLWTSVTHDHYRTLCLHFIRNGQMVQKVLRTKQVFDPQMDTVVAEQIGAVLKEFGVAGKVVAMSSGS